MDIAFFNRVSILMKRELYYLLTMILGNSADLCRLFYVVFCNDGYSIY
jgi:hypothetical protein